MYRQKDSRLKYEEETELLQTLEAAVCMTSDLPVEYVKMVSLERSIKQYIIVLVTGANQCKVTYQRLKVVAADCALYMNNLINQSKYDKSDYLEITPQISL